MNSDSDDDDVSDDEEDHYEDDAEARGREYVARHSYTGTGRMTRVPFH